MKCPECNGPTKVVYETAEYMAIQCISGHWRSQRKYGSTRTQKIFPVYIVAKEVER